MPEVKATHRHMRTSAFKVREVLDLVRGLPVDQARDVLRFHGRSSAREVLKVLNSAVANAEHNNHIPGEQLYVSSCFADEGVTLKRWRPRARGRATRIRKRTSHLTVIVDRMSEEMIEKSQAREERKTSSRAARVAGSRRAEGRRAKKEIAEVEQELAEAPEEGAEAGAEAEASVEASEDAGAASDADSPPHAGTPSTSAAPSTDEAGSGDEEVAGAPEPEAADLEKEEEK